jgi:hypothetical protein
MSQLEGMKAVTTGDVARDRGGKKKKLEVYCPTVGRGRVATWESCRLNGGFRRLAPVSTGNLNRSQLRESFLTRVSTGISVVQTGLSGIDGVQPSGQSVSQLGIGSSVTTEGSSVATRGITASQSPNGILAVPRLNSGTWIASRLNLGISSLNRGGPCVST